MGYHAFEECSAQIKKTEGGVIYYEKWAIDYEDDIAAVVLRDGTVGIAAKAFRNCSSLTSITIPDSVIGIASDAFFGCDGLTSITIPDSVTSIGNYAFRNCSGLTSVTIGNGVTSIGYMAFAGCTGLTSVTFNGTIDEWNAIGKSIFWYVSCPFSEVVCSDGTVNV